MKLKTVDFYSKVDYLFILLREVSVYHVFLI